MILRFYLSIISFFLNDFMNLISVLIFSWRHDVMFLCLSALPAFAHPSLSFILLLLGVSQLSLLRSQMEAAVLCWVAVSQHLCLQQTYASWNRKLQHPQSSAWAQTVVGQERSPVEPWESQSRERERGWRAMTTVRGRETKRWVHVCSSCLPLLFQLLLLSSCLHHCCPFLSLHLCMSSLLSHLHPPPDSGWRCIFLPELQPADT